jgi:hypothetical protein
VSSVTPATECSLEALVCSCEDTSAAIDKAHYCCMFYICGASSSTVVGVSGNFYFGGQHARLLVFGIPCWCRATVLG